MGGAEEKRESEGPRRTTGENRGAEESSGTDWEKCGAEEKRRAEDDRRAEKKIRQLRENIGYVIANLNGLSEQTRVSLTELNRNVAKTLEDSSNQTNQAIKRVTSDMETLSSEICEQATKITDCTNKITTQFQKIIDNIHNEFVGISRISEIVKDAERVNEALSKIGNQADTFENTSKIIEEHGNRIASGARGVEEATNEYIEELSKTSEVLRSKIR